MTKIDDETLSRRMARAVHGYLRQVLPWGGVAQTDEALDKYQGWLRQRRHQNRMELKDLMRILVFWKIDPARFFWRALRSFAQRGEEGGELVRLGIDPPAGEAPKIVGLVRRRLAEVAAGGEERSLEEEIAAVDSAKLLQRLDAERYKNPRRAANLAAKAVDKVDVAALPTLLGVAGSAYRLWKMRLDEAQHCIHAGVEIAEERGDRSVVGDLLQRLSYVIGDRGEHADALTISERAMMIHLRLGDMARVGQTQVDQALFLNYLDRPEEAIEANKAALKLLPKSEVRHRFSAHQHLADTYRKLGTLDRAYHHVKLAAKIASELGPLLKSKLYWAESAILIDLRRFEQGEDRLRKAITLLRSVHYGEMALAMTELVRVLLLQGRQFEAWKTARSMRELVWQIEKNKIISAAIGSLIWARRETLTLKLVEKAKAAIEKARERRDWHSLAVRLSQT